MSVTFNNHNTDVQASSASSFSASMSVTAGNPNLCAVVRICLSGGGVSQPAISGNVTYNSVNMTAAGALQGNNSANKAGLVMYVLAGPSTGSNTLAFSITNGPVNTIYADLTSYYNVNQSTPVRASSFTSLDQTSSASTISLTINSAVGDMTTTCTDDGASAVNLSSTNQTQRSLDNTGQSDFGSDDAAGATTVTHTWTYGGNSNDLLMAGFSIQQVATVPAEGILLSQRGPGRSPSTARFQQFRLSTQNPVTDVLLGQICL